MPAFLSSLLQRTRTGLLAVLLVVLPLQGVVQLMAGLQGHRHVHTGAVGAAHDSMFSSLARPVRALLDELHAGQDPRLKAPRWSVSVGEAGEMHEHGGVFHKHGQDTADVLDVGDPADDAKQGGATAFLAWLPAPAVLSQVEVTSGHPRAADASWRDRVVAPPVTPPRA